MKLPVPCTIVTGSLGAGKTTLISKLLANKPNDEKYAVIVNEFGSLGIDAALMSQGVQVQTTQAGVAVREIAGGCLCCVTSGMLGIAIAQLLRQAKPDRLIIEPSGLGHPAGLLQTLQSEHLKTAIKIQAVICLVDSRTAGDANTRDPTAEDQINVADVLIGSKADLSSEEQLQQFRTWAEGLWPPKQQVQVWSQDHDCVPLELLSLAREPVYTPLITPNSRTTTPRRSTKFGNNMQPTTSSNPAQGVVDEAFIEKAASMSLKEGIVDIQTAGAQSMHEHEHAHDTPSPGHPCHYVTNASAEHKAYGWLFHSEDVFHEGRLRHGLHEAICSGIVVRLKGVFRELRCDIPKCIPSYVGSKPRSKQAELLCRRPGLRLYVLVMHRVSTKLWKSINWVRSSLDQASSETDTQLYTSCYQKDSRVEMIVERRWESGGGMPTASASPSSSAEPGVQQSKQSVDLVQERSSIEDDNVQSKDGHHPGLYLDDFERSLLACLSST